MYDPGKLFSFWSTSPVILAIDSNNLVLRLWICFVLISSAVLRRAVNVVQSFPIEEGAATHLLS